MSTKAETISQLYGFGNKIQASRSEHFRSAGLSESPFGMTASRTIKSWVTDADFADDPDKDSFEGIEHFTAGSGLASDGGGGNYVYFKDRSGDILQAQNGISTPELVYPHKNSSHFNTGFAGGLIIDQKGRLLYAGERKLGMFDGAIDNRNITITATNGSDNFVKTSGDDFLSTDEEHLIRVSYDSKQYYFRINSRISATEVDLYGSGWTFPTGSYSAVVMLSWDDNWKDFGSDYNDSTQDGYDAYIATETYEDTVLFGRNNNITTLNTLTDTVTTDASPAFNLPSGYDITHIHKGANGILIGANFQGKGVLVLWDNYSDRSIAPWIELPDRLISMCKYNGGWIIITAREFYYTNGYSLEVLADSLLDMHIDPLAPQPLPQTSVVIENHLHFKANYSANGKRREGVYRMNLSTRRVEFIGKEDMNVYDENITSLFYSNVSGNTRLFVGETLGISYIDDATPPTVSHLITNPVGKGANTKYAEAVKLDLGIDPTYYATSNTFSFEAIVKICPLDQQVQAPAVVKTTQPSSTTIEVDETVYAQAQKGDEIEFLNGNNAGYTRNITSIADGGTDTAIYTLDRALPALASANDNIVRTRFQLVANKAFSAVSDIDPKLLWYTIKNKIKGKRYLLKVEIEDADVPIEIRPQLFVYDDQGIIM
jgi:hypothetical protein